MSIGKYFKRFSLFACTILALTVTAGAEEKNDPEKGTVIFYRTRSAKGSAIGLNITGGDTGMVGVLKNGSKIVKEMPVGEFTFVVNSPSIAGQDSVTIDVEAGKTYYVKGEAKWGWPAARPGFTLMDEKKGKAESDKTK
jgi:hypothetical protein